MSFSFSKAVVKCQYRYKAPGMFSGSALSPAGNTKGLASQSHCGRAACSCTSLSQQKHLQFQSMTQSPWWIEVGGGSVAVITAICFLRQPPGGDVSGLLAFFSSIIFPLSSQHTPRQANLPFPVSLTFPIQSSFFWPKQKFIWIVRPFVNRECLFSFLNHWDLNYPTKEQKGMPHLPLTSQGFKRTFLKPSEDSCWSMDSCRGILWMLLPLWMTNFYLLGGGPENRTVLILFSQRK